MENKLLEEKHQRKLLQDCTQQVIITLLSVVFVLSCYSIRVIIDHVT